MSAQPGYRFRNVLVQALMHGRGNLRGKRSWFRTSLWLVERLASGGPAPRPPEGFPPLDTLRCSAKLQQDLNSQGLIREEVDWKGAFWEMWQRAGADGSGRVADSVIARHTRTVKNDQHLKVKPELLLWLVERVR